MYTNLEILSREFIEWLQMRGYSETSFPSYRRHLAGFTAFLKNEEITHIEEITPRTIYNYQTHLFYSKKKNDEPLSILTQSSALAVVKTFFEFLVLTDRLSVDPSANLVLPKKPDSLPEVMTREEVERLLEEPDTKDIIGFRDRTILEVLYITGMRNSEACQLALVDVDFKNEEMRIRQGKGKRDRIVPLGEYALEYLREYVLTARPRLAGRRREPAAQLFLSKTGNKLTPGALNTLVKHHAKKAGLTKNVTAHTLRHTCATHLLQGGADIRYIQELLGHTSLESTQIYTRVEISDLKEIHRQYHPREQ